MKTRRRRFPFENDSRNNKKKVAYYIHEVNDTENLWVADFDIATNKRHEDGTWSVTSSVCHSERPFSERFECKVLSQGHKSAAEAKRFAETWDI